MKIFLVIILFFNFFSLNAIAEIYQSVDKNGITTFSDQPNTSSTNVTLPAANIAVQPIAAHTSSTDTATTNAVEKKVPYTVFKISSPKDQDSIFNQPEITVSVTISPNLQAGDKIQFYYDGIPTGPLGTNTSITISKVQDGKEVLVRGSHTLYATLVNAEGDVLNTSPTITIFLHYASVNTSMNTKKTKTVNA